MPSSGQSPSRVGACSSVLRSGWSLEDPLGDSLVDVSGELSDDGLSVDVALAAIVPVKRRAEHEAADEHRY